MSVEGLCEICESEPAEEACRLCGRIVCDRHFDEDAGVCVECASTIETGERVDEQSPEDLPDGVDTYEF